MKKGLVFLCSLLATSHVFAQLSITAVSPDQADPGTTGLMVTFTLPNSTPPTPPVEISPDSVMIGSLVGKSVNRPSLDTVTAVFDIPAGEAVGAKDCTVTFTTPMGTTVFTKTGGFTVGAAAVDVYTNGPPASGYNLFSPLTSTNTYLMDNDDNIVKTWSSSYNPGQSVYLLDDGSLLRPANTGSTNFNTGGCAGRVEQYDWVGNLTWAYDYDTTEHRSHHDVRMLPNGHVLMIAWEKKTETEAVNLGRNPSLLNDGELWPDSIIEVAPTGSYGGTIVWEWHAWDHLIQDYFPLAANYGVVADHPELIDLNYGSGNSADWLHINSIDYNAERDQILLSVHNFSEIWVIDHSTTTAEAAGSAGDLLYRWGNPAAYDSGTSTDQQLFAQHNAHWIGDGLPGAGDILIFNNGQNRPGGDYSSVDEIVPPVAPDGSYTNGLPLAPVWTYTNSVATNFYADHISGAQRLKNGNTLICEGTEGYVFEVTSDGGLVWDYTDNGNLFRFERYAPDFAGFDNTELALPTVPYAVVDTHQTTFFDTSSEITEPATNDVLHGQDAGHAGNQPCYEISPDGLTVYDYNTGLTWTRSPDWNADGTIDINDKMTQSEASTYVDTVNAASFGGHSDWRLPTIKEMYSLMDFRGTDPMSDDTSTLVPFIDSDYFEFAWGDTNAGERTIDSQVATSTLNQDPVMGGGIQTMPGLNIVDGRIKGYPITKDFLVYYCRGNTSYGVNDFEDNGDGTVTDHATGLMWQQNDSGAGMLWADALDYAQAMNASNYLGHSDWRLPNAKELHSILDYNLEPTTDGSASIDPIFTCTTITNEGGAVDWPWYFTGTTHIQQDGGASHAVYVCFGRAMGYFNSVWEDVHGSGAQRSELKTYDTAGYTYIPDGWYFTTSPQGDAARWYNYVRLVRDAELTAVDTTPVVGITTTNQTVAYAVTEFSISGTNNEWVVGSLVWSNELTAANGTVAVSGTNFSIASIALDTGTNRIAVTGTNSLGIAASDSVSIVRESTPAYASVIYVNASTPAAPGAQDGTAWATAFEDLQDALAVATTQEIWVAAGVYYPDEAAAGFAMVTNDSSATFTLIDGISLYGGFAGDETNLSQRDPGTHSTILSGDIDQNDADEGLDILESYTGIAGTNSLHVITVAEGVESLVLDGFIVTAGDAGGTDAEGKGAGLYAAGGTFEIRQMGFYGNAAYEKGAGLFADSADLVVSNCTFAGNGSYRGGGMLLSGGTSEVVSCTFSGNAVVMGFKGGHEQGAGMMIENGASGTVRACSIINNSADDDGAGLCIDASDITVQDCTFRGNEATFNGGAVLVNAAEVIFINPLMTGNKGNNGGALHARNSGSKVTLVNASLSGNQARSLGGAIFNNNTSSVTIENSIIWNNQSDGEIATNTASVVNLNSSTTTVYHCLIANSGGSINWDAGIGIDGGNNLDEDPQFLAGINPATAPNENGTFSLSYTSPAINAGSNALVNVSTDLDGNARIYDSIVDMGCYEATDDGSDADGDSLTDYAEGVHYGSDPALADTDGDGSDDGDEAFIGSDLTDEGSVFLISIQNTGADELTLSWPTFKSGLFYEVYATTNLVSGEWEYVGATSASNLTRTVTNNVIFCRVEVIDGSEMF